MGCWGRFEEGNFELCEVEIHEKWAKSLKKKRNKARIFFAWDVKKPQISIVTTIEKRNYREDSTMFWAREVWKFVREQFEIRMNLWWHFYSITFLRNYKKGRPNLKQPSLLMT